MKTRTIRAATLLLPWLCFIPTGAAAVAVPVVINSSWHTNCTDGAPPPAGQGCAAAVTRGANDEVELKVGPNAVFRVPDDAPFLPPMTFTAFDDLPMTVESRTGSDGCGFLQDVWMHTPAGGCRIHLSEQTATPSPACVSNPPDTLWLVRSAFPDFPDNCDDPGFSGEILGLPETAEVGEIATVTVRLTNDLEWDANATSVAGCMTRILAIPDVVGFFNQDPRDALCGRSFLVPAFSIYEREYTGTFQKPGSGRLSFDENGVFGNVGGRPNSYASTGAFESNEVEVTGGLTLELGLPSTVSPDGQSFALTVQVTNHGSSDATIDPIDCDDFLQYLECSEEALPPIACDPDFPEPGCCEPNTDPECCDPLVDPNGCECDEFSILERSGDGSPAGPITLGSGATQNYTCPYQTLGERGRGYFGLGGGWTWTHESGGVVDLEFECPGQTGTCVDDNLIVEVGDEKAPVAAFTVSLDPSDPLRRIFDATTSEDEDGTIELYEWDLAGTPAFGLITSKSFPPGTHTISLTVTDDHGLQDTKTDQIFVSNPTPGMWRIGLDDPSGTLIAVLRSATGSIFELQANLAGLPTTIDLDTVSQAAIDANCGMGPRSNDRLLGRTVDQIGTALEVVDDEIADAVAAGASPPAPGSEQTLPTSARTQRRLRTLVGRAFDALVDFETVARESAGRLEAVGATLTVPTSPPGSTFRIDVGDVSAHLDADGNVTTLSGSAFSQELCDGLAIQQPCDAIQLTRRDLDDAIDAAVDPSVEANPELGIDPTRRAQALTARNVRQMGLLTRLLEKYERSARGALRNIGQRQSAPGVEATTVLVPSPGQVRKIERLQRKARAMFQTLTTIQTKYQQAAQSIVGSIGR